MPVFRCKCNQKLTLSRTLIAWQISRTPSSNALTILIFKFHVWRAFGFFFWTQDIPMEYLNAGWMTHRHCCFEVYVFISSVSASLKSFRDVSGLWEFWALLCLSLKRAWIFNIHPPNHTVYRVTISVGTGQGRTVQRSPAMFFDLYLSRWSSSLECTSLREGCSKANHLTRRLKLVFAFE